MMFSEVHKVISYVFAALGLSVLMLSGGLSEIEKIVTILLVVGTWFIEKPILERENYTKFITSIAVGGFFIQVMRLFLSGIPLLPLGIEYAVLLQLVKLAHRKKAVDYQHIAILAFLHLIAGSVLSSELEYGVIFIGFVIVMPWMLALSHMRTEIEAQHELQSRSEMHASLQQTLANRKLASASFFWGTTALSIPLFVVTAALFLAFPRVGLGYLGQFGRRAEAIAGFGNDVELGGFGAIRDDPTVVMRIKVIGAEDPQPTTLPIRLRGTSFDRYYDARWTRSIARSSSVMHQMAHYPIVRPVQPERDWHYEITLGAIEEPVLFLPQGTVELEIPPSIKAGSRRYHTVKYSPGLDFRFGRIMPEPLTYTAHIDPGISAYVERVPEQIRREYYKIPEDYGRVAELAREIVGNTTSPIEQAQRIQRYLSMTGGFAYTTIQPDVGDRDPLHVFLFEAKAGHCEYYSTAMAVMLRSLGIPSRNVTGFLGAELNPYGGFYVVRNANAHSWVEAQIDNKWITFDPTPSGRQVVISSQSLVAKLRNAIEALRVRWAEYIVEYDLQTQTRYLRAISAWFQNRSNTNVQIKNTADPEKTSSKSFKSVAWSDWAAVIAIIGFLSLVFGWWYSRFRNARRRKRNTRGFEEQRATRLYRILENSLKKRGHVRPPDMTPKELVKCLREQQFHQTELVSEITDVYLAARFGEECISDRQFARFYKLAKQMESGSLKQPPL